MRVSHKAIILLAMLAHPIWAKDLGSLGHTFSIQEEDMRISIQKKLQGSQKTFPKELKTIEPVRGLPNVSKRRTHYFDPSYTATETLQTKAGKIIVKKGETTNPLTGKTLSSGLLFFDGENKTHIDWAREQVGEYKWILCRGNPFTMEERTTRPIYFDQEGKISKKLGLTAIPAKVVQDGLLLKIEEGIEE